MTKRVDYLREDYDRMTIGNLRELLEQFEELPDDTPVRFVEWERFHSMEHSIRFRPYDAEASAFVKDGRLYLVELENEGYFDDSYDDDDEDFDEE